MKPLLSPESAAEVLDVSRSTVLRMIADGALPAICLRAGTRKKVWKIRQEVLEKWVLQKEKETARKIGQHAQAYSSLEHGNGESTGQQGAAIAVESSAS